MEQPSNSRLEGNTANVGAPSVEDQINAIGLGRCVLRQGHPLPFPSWCGSLPASLPPFLPSGQGRTEGREEEKLEVNHTYELCQAFRSVRCDSAPAKC